MSTPLRVLLVDDTQESATLIERELRRSGFDPAVKRAATPRAFRAAVTRQTWDIVVAVHSTAHFGLDALKVLQESDLDLPFILVSSTPSAEEALAATRAGAHDYVMKDDLTRLGVAVQRELREAEVRHAHKRAEEALRTGAEVSRRLLRTRRLPKVLPEILLRLGEAARVSRVYLFENHLGPEGELLCRRRYEWCAPGVEPQIDHPEMRDFSCSRWGLTRWAETLRRGDVIAGVTSDFPRSEQVVLDAQGVGAFLAIPLLISNAWYGFVGFDVCDGGREWQQAEVDVMCAVVSEVASAIEREQAAQRAQALSEAARALTSTLDAEQVLDGILQQVGRVVPGDAANIMLVERDQARVARWRGYERFGAEELLATTAFPIAEMPNLRLMMQSASPRVVPDTTSCPSWAAIPGLEWLRSYAAAPIVVRGEVIGFLNVDSATPGFFSEAHIGPLRAFAGYAAAAIENARLFQAEQRQSRRLALLADVARIVATTLDADGLLQAIAECIHRHFAYPMVELLTLDEEGNSLTLRGYSGIAIGPPEEVTPGVYSQPIDQGIIGLVTRTGMPYFASDVREDPYFLNIGGESIRSELCVPILDEGRVVGAIDVESDRLADFDEEDLSLLEAVADTAATGLRNVRLYEETQRRVQELTLLNRISVGFGAALDVDALVGNALSGLQELVGADRTYFITAYAETRSWRISHALLAPGVESNVGRSGAFEDLPAELQTLLDDQPFAVSDVTTDPRVDARREAYLSPDVRSVLLVPVHARDRPYGALGFDFCRERHNWRQDEVRLMAAVAHQLELALENVYLFQEAQRRADALAAALARLEDLDRVKDEFIQNASHELRSPLALIRGYAEMLDTGELGGLQPEQRQPVAIIARRARMLSDLVQDITLILEAEARPPRSEPVPLEELARAALEDFQMAAEGAGLSLRAEIASHLPPVRGSPGYMRRVLDNLLANAVKFTPAGGIVTLRLWQEGREVILQVEDTGIGIPTDELGRVFERFYQVDGSARRRYEGVGLGLALVKEIVEAYGGRVAVESQPHEGSTFTVSLPTAVG